MRIINVKGMRSSFLLFLTFISCFSCRPEINKPSPSDTENYFPATLLSMPPVDSTDFVKYPDSSLAQKIVAFAKTQLGVQYKYCSMTPEGGFDCSGFINYVFNHFNIKVPRSSVDFTNEGTEVSLSKCKPGDLILFTGTDSHIRIVGHIGLIVANDNGNISFIQATSGAEYCVTISPLNKSYMVRFVKVIRLIDNG